jgi:DNA-binding CsgD family transcriptional regulator
VAVREVQLLEREAELGELVAALEHARAGSGHLVLLEGAAGIGKTRLLRAARKTASRIGMQVLAARGTELERGFPFALVRQLFEPALQAADQPRREELLDGAAGPAGPVIGVQLVGDSGVGDSLVDPSFATLNALYWLTSNLAEAGPLMLAIDDAHWADPPSLRFVRFLLPRLEELPVLLVLAARPSEPGTEPELLGQLGSDPAVGVLRLRPLSERAVSELICSELSESAEDGFCAACYEAAGGNPFMLRELLGELKRAGSVGADADIARVREVVPVTIQRAVLGRLARIGAPAQQLAGALAVLGERSQPQLVAELAGVDQGGAAEAIDPLAAAGILESGRPLRFVHPLVRNAVYSDLPEATKSKAHRQAADLLARDGAEPERIAIHLLATDPAADRGVVETLRAAAGRALERAAPEAAVAYLRRALAEPPIPDLRPDLVRLLIRAQLRAADREGFEELHGSGEFAQLIAEPQRLLSSVDELATALYTWGRSEEMAALLERATAAAIDVGDYDLAGRFQVFLAAHGLLPPPQGLARIRRLEGRITPDSPTERLFFVFRSYWGLLVGEAPTDVAELARHGVQGGRIWREFPGTPLPTFAIYALQEIDQLDAAARAGAERAAALAGRGGGVYETTIQAWINAKLAWGHGEIARAEAFARTTVEAALQGGFLVGMPIWLADLVELLVERDELVAAQAELARTAMEGALPENWIYTPVLFSRARLGLAQGAARSAVDDLLACRRILDEAGIQAPNFPTAAYLALALHGIGDLPEAHAVAEQELVNARDYGLPRRLGIALRTLGLLEQGERGLEWLRESIGVLESSPSKLEHARSLTEYGAALRRANRRAEAREPLRAALDTTRRTGALAVARRAHDELAATGEKLRPLLAGGVESLTPSELRVSEMAALGMHNREIAQALFLTLKTIETHLSNAYRKLDIRSRAQLPHALNSEP